MLSIAEEVCEVTNNGHALGEKLHFWGKHVRPRTNASSMLDERFRPSSKGIGVRWKCPIRAWLRGRQLRSRKIHEKSHQFTQIY